MCLSAVKQKHLEKENLKGAKATRTYISNSTKEPSSSNIIFHL